MASESTRNKTSKTRPPRADAKGPERDPKGRYLLGHSPNPGGFTKTQREARAAFMQGVPRAWEVIGEWLESDDTERVKVALETIFTRALGRPPKAGELPLLQAARESAPGSGEPAKMAAEVRALMARTLLETGQRIDQDGAGEDVLQLLVVLGKGLADIRKTEAEAKAASKAGTMTDAELMDAVINQMGPEAVSEALERRRAAQADAKPASGGP